MSATKPPVLPAWADTGDKVQPSNADISVGWPYTGKPPSRQRFNWILNYVMNAVRYFSRRGIADYDAAETYMTNDLTIGDDGKTYRSLIDNNLNNAPSANPAKWERWGFRSSEAVVQNYSGLVRSLTPLGGALVREWADSVAATTGNIEIGKSYNCAVDPVTGVWAARDVNDICWLEKWSDTGGLKEFWFAPAAAAGAVPVWTQLEQTDMINAVKTFNGKISVNAATASTQAPQAGQVGAFDGWNNDSHTWVYASASSFAIAGVDLTGTYKKGLKLRWTDSGGVKYGYVASSSFAANTTVNIVVNTSYTIANSAITAPAFSFASAPANFPSQFGFASTIAGLVIGAGGIYFSLNNGICTLFFGSALNGTSNSGAFYCSVPIAASTSDSSGYIYGNTLAAYDNSAWQTAPASAGIANGSTTLNFGKSAANFAGNIFGGFTASGGKAIQGTFSYPF